ncbi:CRACD-like protein isoform X3 [Narcine bancroftii]|uniref:CRACD-like protein isoform X3 n=1 Tax=Narcine bancroftii TaxID=1343680 RepID=UPI0038314D26
MATGLTDIKMQESEEPTEGKKKLRFKSLKRLFVKKKKKESMTKTNLKQSQSTSDVTYPGSQTPDPDSEDERSACKSILGIRALSHDSIFIPDTSGEQSVLPVRVFSQETVSAPIRALQLKVQQNIKPGPPPKLIPSKRMEDTGASSEDDGLPRSPPESSPIHEALARSQLSKYSDHYKNHSSLTLGGTGSEEEEQISPGSSSRPNSPLSAVIQTRSRARSRSPTSLLPSSENPTSSVVDFNSPPMLSICLDNSAARHRLSVKPRNQRSHTKRRSSSRLLSDAVGESMYHVPELKEENEQEIIKDNAEFAVPEMNLDQRAESPTVVPPRGEPLALSIIMPEAINTIEQRSDESPLVDASSQQDSAASHDILDDIDPLEACSVPIVPSEIADVTPRELDPLDVSATQVSVLSGSVEIGSMVVISDDSSSLDVADPSEEEKDVNIWEIPVNSRAGDAQAIPVDRAFVNETEYPMQTLVQSDISLIDSDKLFSSAPEGAQSSEGESLQEDPHARSEQVKEEPTPDKPVACSNEQMAIELSNHEDTIDERFSRIALAQVSEMCSQTVDASNTLKDFSVLEAAHGSSPEDRDTSVFKPASNKISEEKILSRQSSFKKSSQGSFKFSISSAWNRSKNNGAKCCGAHTSDLEVSSKTSPQKVSSFLGKESKVKDEGVTLHEPSATKAEGQENEAAHKKDEEGRSAFGVRLRSTSYCSRYKNVPHTENREVAKRPSAEASLESGDCPSQPSAENTEVKKPPEGTSLIDDGNLRTKSTENLAARPILPKKPILQNLNPSSTALDKTKTVKSTQERLKDSERKMSVSKNSADKGQPLTKSAPDNGPPVEDPTIPAWVTMARQKQKGYQEQYIGKEAKTPAKEVKDITEGPEVDKRSHCPWEEAVPQPGGAGSDPPVLEATSALIESKSTPPKSSTLGKPIQDCRLELKPCVAETPKKGSPKTSPVTVNIHSSGMTQNTLDKDGKDQHSKDKISPSSNQPSWMELAKKKAKAWSDMPQIIK